MRFLSKALVTLIALGVSSGVAPAASVDPPAGGAAHLLRPEAVRVAVLPLRNLSGEAVPMGAFQQWLLDELELYRIPLLDDMALRAFLRRHRMRDVGGLSKEMGRAMQEETGASAVLVSSIDLAATTLVACGVALDGELSRLDGLILSALFVVFIVLYARSAVRADRSS